MMGYLGNLYETDLWPWAIWCISVVVTVVCGALVGVERERREKPAGLRTVILISLGSTIFTIVSIAMASEKPISDPARVAAQIIPGIGFLGAGAIIHARGSVVGLTTGATVWAVAAVGMTIGAGYVLLGIGFTTMIYLTLTVASRLDWLAVGPCEYRRATVRYEAKQGKARIYIQDILDNEEIPDEHVQELDPEGDERRISIRVCCSHREHRAVLKELADLPAVTKIGFSGHELAADRE